MKQILKTLWNVLGIVVGLVLLLGLFLFICEDVFGVTPHFYFTKYMK